MARSLEQLCSLVRAGAGTSLPVACSESVHLSHMAMEKRVMRKWVGNVAQSHRCHWAPPSPLVLSHGDGER